MADVETSKDDLIALLDSREAYVWVGEYRIVAVSLLKNVFVGWEWIIIIILELTLIAAAACIAFFCNCGGEGFSCVSCVSRPPLWNCGNPPFGLEP